MAKKEKKKVEKKLEERPFVVSFSKVYRAPRPKRAFRAINFLKKFAFKHFRVKGEDVFISQAVNEAIWAKGREHIPRKIEIKIVKDEEKAKIYLKDEKIKAPKKEKPVEKKEEKKIETAEETVEKKEIEKKKKDKTAKEKAAELSQIKRGTGK